MLHHSLLLAPFNSDSFHRTYNIAELYRWQRKNHTAMQGQTIRSSWLHGHLAPCRWFSLRGPFCNPVPTASSTKEDRPLDTELERTHSTLANAREQITHLMSRPGRSFHSTYVYGACPCDSTSCFCGQLEIARDY